MVKLFTSLKAEVENNEDVMLVGIFAASGSVPRGTGAKMLVTERGRIFGTIGGGSVEHGAEIHATALLKQKTSDMQSFKLTPNNIKDLGMVCGGEVSVYFMYISGKDIHKSELFDYTLCKLEKGEQSWLITGIDGKETWQMGIYSVKDGFVGISEVLGLAFTDIPHRQNINGREYLVEPLVRLGVVYIFGGGHVAQALVPMAAKVGFRCAVFDDRAEFTNPELFPDATKVCTIDFSDIAKTVSITKSDYVVIMTRGHQYDSIVQAQAMHTAARYIGVMGSKRKIAHVSEQMRELGFADADLARIKTPIGLDICAETPEEIAVSIVAELIMVRANKVSKK